MSNPLDEEKIREHFEKAKKSAEDIINEPEKLKGIADRAWQKTKKLKEPMAKVWDQLVLMIKMVKASISREYTEIPTTSLIAIVAGLIYFISPIDFIPDFIPVLGYLDDIFVIGVVFTQVAQDIERFSEWLKTKEADIQREEDNHTDIEPEN